MLPEAAAEAERRKLELEQEAAGSGEICRIRELGHKIQELRFRIWAVIRVFNSQGFYIGFRFQGWGGQGLEFKHGPARGHLRALDGLHKRLRIWARDLGVSGLGLGGFRVEGLRILRGGALEGSASFGSGG